MFAFYCNQCFRRRKFEATLQLNVSRCGHILCKECVQDNCIICNRPFKSVPINKDMPQAMAEYFSSPIKQYQHYQKVMRFHYDQEKRLVDHMARNNKEQNNKTNDEKQGYIKLRGTIKREAEHESERRCKIREYLAYHERRFEQVRYMTPPIPAMPQPRYPSRSPRSDHVVPSTTSHNVVPQLSQSLKPNVIYPHSPTISANNSSITTEGTELPKSAAKRTPPPLLPFSQHKMLNKHFSFSTMD